MLAGLPAGGKSPGAGPRMFANAARKVAPLLVFLFGRILAPQCVQSKAGAFRGSQSRQGKSQEPCSLSRRQEGNRMF